MATLPQIEDPLTGEPRQPVALRLVPLITQLRVDEILYWLSEPPLEEMGCLLTAYEYQPDGNHRIPTPQMYAAIREEVTRESSFRKKLARLPASHFVWSDELATAFTEFIDLFMDRDDAAADGMGLVWNVAIGPYASLIGECPDFSGQGAQRRVLRKLRTAARNAEWQRRVDERALALPKMSHTKICEIVAKDLRGIGQETDPVTVRRNTKKRR